MYGFGRISSCAVYHRINTKGKAFEMEADKVNKFKVAEQREKVKKPPFFTPEEVAERYQVKKETVRRWIREGWMPALDLGCGERFGPYRITERDLREFEDRQYRKAILEEADDA